MPQAAAIASITAPPPRFSSVVVRAKVTVIGRLREIARATSLPSIGAIHTGPTIDRRADHCTAWLRPAEEKPPAMVHPRR